MRPIPQYFGQQTEPLNTGKLVTWTWHVAPDFWQTIWFILALSPTIPEMLITSPDPIEACLQLTQFSCLGEYEQVYDSQAGNTSARSC
jgi:hypothetical protein